MSIFWRYFSTFSCPKIGIEKHVFSANFSSQNVLRLSKLEGAIGFCIFEDTDTKKLLNLDEISELLSIVLSLIFNENTLVAILRLRAPNSLKSFHTLKGLFTFSFSIQNIAVSLML